jgi:hypothetical protein
MWAYLALGVGSVVALNVLIVLVMAVLARRAEPDDEADPDLRARLEQYVEVPGRLLS